MNNTARQIEFQEVEQELDLEVRAALDNIKNTMKAQAAKGNKDAEFLLKHL